MDPRDPILQFFRFDHLPAAMQAVSKPFGELAERVHATLPKNAERSVALRRLLEQRRVALLQERRLLRRHVRGRGVVEVLGSRE